MSKYFSPLLFPVRLENDIILVLDETKLPFEEYFISVRSLEEAVRVLSEMKTRALGQVLLFFYSTVLFKDEIAIREIAEKFKEERPTFAFELLADIIEGELAKRKDIKDIVDHFILNFDKKRKQRMYNLAKDLPQQANVLTICNVNGELIYLYEEMQKLNKKIIFYISETRPYLQGTRLTFWELVKNKIPAKLVCDNQVAYLMRQKKINAIIVGADRATVYNDIINK
ncbi:MAG: hypothetical protein N2Z79_00400, partial [Candidatus Omnitrophica bacterium]|nr:hypothetical protein [Candidatus Omnitrophota bacterium]